LFHNLFPFSFFLLKLKQVSEEGMGGEVEKE